MPTKRDVGTVITDPREIGELYRQNPGAPIRHDPSKVDVKPRESTAERAAAANDDDDDYDYEISYSSDAPVRRYFGIEICDHSPGAVDQSRLNNGAMLLEDHRSDKKLGVVRKAWIGPDGRGYARVKFSNSAPAQAFRQDVEQRIATLVSFAYDVQEMKLTGVSDNGDETWLVTKRQDLEISFVGVPADPTVGAGRSRNFEVESKPTTERRTMPTETTSEQVELAAEQQLVAAIAAERKRTANIISLCREHGCSELAEGLLQSDAGELEVLRQILAHKPQPKAAAQYADPSERQQQKPLFTGDIGLTKKEVQRWSLLKCLRALDSPQSRQAQDDAGFEREVTTAMGAARGRDYQGFGMPIQRLYESFSDQERNVHLDQSKRELTVGSPASAGLLVDTDFRPQNLIAFLENRLVFSRMGSPIVTELSGNLEFPREIGSNTPTMLAESGDATLSDMQVGRITWAPHTVGAATDISRRLLIQSSLDAEAVATRRLLSSVAVEMDSQLLTGDGTGNNMLGLKNITGVNAITFAATNPTYPEVVSLWSATASSNADIGTAGYLTTPPIYGGLLTTDRFTGSGNPVLQQDGRINGSDVVYSNQVNANDLYYGFWSQFLIAMFSGLDITRDLTTKSRSGGMRIVVLVDADGNALNPESFSRGNVAG